MVTFSPSLRLHLTIVQLLNFLLSSKLQFRFELFDIISVRLVVVILFKLIRVPKLSKMVIDVIRHGVVIRYVLTLFMPSKSSLSVSSTKASEDAMTIVNGTKWRDLTFDVKYTQFCG